MTAEDKIRETVSSNDGRSIYERQCGDATMWIFKPNSWYTELYGR